MRIFDMLKAGQDEYILSESINLIGMCYTSLGQKPDKEQMKGMANLLYQDIINYHTNLTLFTYLYSVIAASNFHKKILLKSLYEEIFRKKTSKRKTKLGYGDLRSYKINKK